MLNKKGLATLSLFVTILSCISLIITGSSKPANDVSSDNLFSTNQANSMAASQASYKNTINVGDSDPETDSFTSSRSSVVSSFPPTVVPGANLGPDLSGNIGLLINLLQTNRTNLLSTFLSSKCIASAITAGSSNITTEGNLIIGTNCDDVIHGTKGDAIIYTLAGNDRADGGEGNDIIYAGDGDDRLYGGKGNDIIVGKGGANLLDSGPGNDVIIAGAGNSLEVGGTGNDALIAGAGTSIMVGGSGLDSIDCGTIGISIALDYDPSEGDIISGQCKTMNDVGNSEPTALPPP